MINPINHPVLPRSASHDLDPSSFSPSSNPYHRLEGPTLEQPSVLSTSLFSVRLPDRACFLPVLSFVTRKGFLDVPIPSLPDFIVAFRALLPEYPDYSRGLLAPLQQLQQNPALLDWRRRQNCLFFRGNPTRVALSVLAFPGTERSLLVARSLGVAEIAESQLRAAPVERFERLFVEEKAEFAFSAMFASLLRCRFAMWEKEAIWIVA